MARRRLTDEEREQRRKENLEKVLRGRPNPGGHRGSEKLWRGQAENVLRELTGSQPVTGDPDLDFFGLSVFASMADVKKAYREMMKRVHPDSGIDPNLQKAQNANVIYDRLRARFA